MNLYQSTITSAKSGKNLIGIDINGKRNDDEPLLVKDLPLYPLPIVREDMSVYELLNMFQLGMAR